MDITTLSCQIIPSPAAGVHQHPKPAPTPQCSSQQIYLLSQIPHCSMLHTSHFCGANFYLVNYNATQCWKCICIWYIVVPASTQQTHKHIHYIPDITRHYDIRKAKFFSNTDILEQKGILFSSLFQLSMHHLDTYHQPYRKQDRSTSSQLHLHIKMYSLSFIYISFGLQMTNHNFAVSAKQTFRHKSVYSYNYYNFMISRHEKKGHFKGKEKNLP